MRSLLALARDCVVSHVRSLSPRFRDLPAVTLRSIWDQSRAALSDEDAALFASLWADAQEVYVAPCERFGDAAVVALCAAAPRARSVRIDASRGLGEDALRALAALPALDTLSLRFCVVPDKALAALAAAPNLRSLDLAGSSGFTESGLRKVLGKCSGLERLDLSHVHAVTSSVVRDLSHMASLARLSLSWCSDYGDSVAKLAKRCKRLEALAVADSRTSDSSLAKLLSSCPALTSLDVSHCAAALQSDKLFKAIAELSRLVVGGPAIGDAVLLRVLQGAPKLKCLEVVGAGKTSPEGVRGLIDAARHVEGLSALSFTACAGIGERAGRAIKEALPDVHTSVVPPGK
eukprot:m51a1_g2317 hypothetical protein (347) ;mRNA; f:485512-486852